jgi:hypothetical protein
MKNDFCSLDEDVIYRLPRRYIGFLASPFQFNVRDGFVMVPADTFKELIGIIVETAIKESV